MNKKTVYIASPYTNSDPKITEINVVNSMNAAEELWQLGFVPFLTLASHYYDKFHFSHSWDEWMNYDKVWLQKCDCLLRLPGTSKGADEEVALATEKKIPIYYSIAELTEAEG